MICTKWISGKINCDIAWGTLYQSGAISLGDFPVSFYDVPHITINSINGGASSWFANEVSATKTNAGTISVLRPTASANINYNFSLIAIGRWKR